MLVHFVKSIRAYNVRSSSTLFSDSNQWNFEIPFPCARFKSLLGYNLITKSWDHQKWDFQTPISWNWKKHALMWDIFLWKTLNSESIEFETYQDGWENWHLYLKTFKTFFVHRQFYVELVGSQFSTDMHIVHGHWYTWLYMSIQV